jgi:hypothetical protein
MTREQAFQAEVESTLENLTEYVQHYALSLECHDKQHQDHFLSMTKSWASRAGALLAYRDEVCEAGCEEPVIFHDADGINLCAKCRDALDASDCDKKES